MLSAGRETMLAADQAPVDTYLAKAWTSLPEAARPLIGHIYVQCSSVGLASFHFTCEDCYVCYESKDAVRFPSFNDGSPPPSWKVFSRCRYDTERRIFYAEVSWSPRTWDGEARREYEMIFDEEFSAIEGGCIRYFAPGSVSMGQRVFGRELQYKRWRPLAPLDHPLVDMPLAAVLKRGGRAPPRLVGLPVGWERESCGPSIDDPSAEKDCASLAACSIRRVEKVMAWMLNPTCPPLCLHSASETLT